MPELLEEIKRHRQDVVSLLQESSVPYRDLYRQAAEGIQEDCYALDPHWLIDHAPALWERMVALDDELNHLEQTKAPEPAYRHTLARLSALVREARALFEQDRRQAEAVRQKIVFRKKKARAYTLAFSGSLSEKRAPFARYWYSPSTRGGLSTAQRKGRLSQASQRPRSERTPAGTRTLDTPLAKGTLSPSELPGHGSPIAVRKGGNKGDVTCVFSPR